MSLKRGSQSGPRRPWMRSVPTNSLYRPDMQLRDTFSESADVNQPSPDDAQITVQMSRSFYNYITKEMTMNTANATETVVDNSEASVAQQPHTVAQNLTDQDREELLRAEQAGAEAKQRIRAIKARIKANTNTPLINRFGKVALATLAVGTTAAVAVIAYRHYSPSDIADAVTA